MDGWNTNVSYWGDLFSAAKMLVSGRVYDYTIYDYTFGRFFVLDYMIIQYMDVSKNRVFKPPKMDGENNGTHPI